MEALADITKALGDKTPSSIKELTKVLIEMFSTIMGAMKEIKTSVSGFEASMKFHSESFDEFNAELKSVRYKNIGDAFSVSVIGAQTGETRQAASVRTTVPSQAEEVAVALAIADPRTKTVLCDSRTAVRNFAKHRVCSAAARILRKGEANGVITSAVIKWFPAHAGEGVASSLGLANHNETANAVARGLAGRALVTAAAEVVDHPQKDIMDTYSEVTLRYRLARRTMALPHPRLTREEAVVLRQLQTNSVITPVLAKHLWPEVYITD
ncbi:uncharacterized protein LOC144178054 [Haemaphysalis longicornis]